MKTIKYFYFNLPAIFLWASGLALWVKAKTFIYSVWDVKPAASKLPGDIIAYSSLNNSMIRDSISKNNIWLSGSEKLQSFIAKIHNLNSKYLWDSFSNLVSIVEMCDSFAYGDHRCLYGLQAVEFGANLFVLHVWWPTDFYDVIPLKNKHLNSLRNEQATNFNLQFKNGKKMNEMDLRLYLKKWTAGFAKPTSEDILWASFSSHAYNTSSAAIPKRETW